MKQIHPLQRKRRLDVAAKSIAEVDAKIAKVESALEKARSAADDPVHYSSFAAVTEESFVCRRSANDCKSA